MEKVDKETRLKIYKNILVTAKKGSIFICNELTIQLHRITGEFIDRDIVNLFPEIKSLKPKTSEYFQKSYPSLWFDRDVYLTQSDIDRARIDILEKSIKLIQSK